MAYENKIVLFYSEGCDSCAITKARLKNYLAKIILHNVDKQGRRGIDAVPLLSAIDANGKTLEAIEGDKANTVYLDFLRRHKDLLIT